MEEKEKKKKNFFKAAIFPIRTNKLVITPSSGPFTHGNNMDIKSLVTNA